MSVPLSVHGGLPRWHMVMFPVKGRPVMMKAKPWFEDKKLTDLLNNPAPPRPRLRLRWGRSIMTDPDYDTTAGDVDELAGGGDGFNPDDPEDANPRGRGTRSSWRGCKNTSPGLSSLRTRRECGGARPGGSTRRRWNASKRRGWPIE